MTICDAIARNAAIHPEKPFAIVLGPASSKTLTYDTVMRQSRAYAAAFSERGVRAGDVVAIMLDFGEDIFPGFIGAMLVGAIPSIFPAMSSKQDPKIFWSTHQRVFDRIEPALILSDEANVALLITHTKGFRKQTASFAEILRDGAPHACDLAAPVESDVAFLQHSSGTTGLKKGVQLSHRAVLTQVKNYATALDASGDDVIVSWLPLYHDMGLIACFILPAILGLTTVQLSPFDWVLRPWTFLDAIETYGATLAWMPNFGFAHVARTAPRARRWNLSSLRAIVNCSEPCKSATFEAFRARFRNDGLRDEALQVCYAMAENVFAVTQTDLRKPPAVIAAEPGRAATEGVVVPIEPTAEALANETYLSCGRPIDGVGIRIVDGDGQTVPDGRIGQIHVTGTSLFSGYYLVEKTTSLRDGWYSTGDLGFVLDGELYVTGRLDDLLIVHGKNIYAHDIEHAIRDQGFKAGRAVALGIYNQEAGSQDLVVVAEREPGAASNDVDIVRSVKAAIFACTGATASDVRLVDAGWLIKTTSGKISREANAKKYVAEFRHAVARANPR